MEEFSALASSLAAGVTDVRGCLILSKDGLVLGSHPPDTETRTTPAWVQFAALGDPERGFAQFGTETWCYVRRGPYAAFAVVGPAARPGLVIDHMEQVLLAAEDFRARRDGLRSPEPTVPSTPTSRPRAHLHPETHPFEEPVVIPAEERANVAARPEPTASTDGGPPGHDAQFDDPELMEADTAMDEEREADTRTGDEGLEADPHTSDDTPPERDGPPGRSSPDRPVETGIWGPEAEGDDVDRFSLAREFGQLLQHDEDDADG